MASNARMIDGLERGVKKVVAPNSVICWRDREYREELSRDN
jgi:hypothetical protein